MKKKVLVALLVATMSFSVTLAGCGTKESPDTEVKNDSSESSETEEVSESSEASEVAEDTEAATGDFSYGDLADLEFLFASGAGGWGTQLEIAEDGSFTGEYHDSEMGDTGDDYPNGTYYYSSFSGKFGNLEKVDDVTYKTKITSIAYKNEVGTEEIIDGVLYKYTDAYGLDNPKDIYFYLAGKKIEGFSEELMSWLFLDEGTTELNSVVLFNENSTQAFIGYDKFN